MTRRTAVLAAVFVLAGVLGAEAQQILTKHIPSREYAPDIRIIDAPPSITRKFQGVKVTFTREAWPEFTPILDPVTGHILFDLLNVDVEVSTDDGLTWRRIRRVTFPGGDIRLPPSQGGGISPTCGFNFDRIDTTTGLPVPRDGQFRLILQNMLGLRTEISVEMVEVN